MPPSTHAGGAALTPAALQAAASEIGTLLAVAGVAISGNPISGPLTIGDANDQALDALKANLESSGTTLNEVTNAVIVRMGGTPVGAVAPLPLEQLVAASAPNCKALRSGKYRVVFSRRAEAASLPTLITLDAPTLKITGSDGVVDSLMANGDCRYAVRQRRRSGDHRPAGIGVLRSLEEPAGFVCWAWSFPSRCIRCR